LKTQRPLINYKLRARRLAVGLTESQVAEEIARLVATQTGRELAIDGNYVSKLERSVITWPNRAYRKAFRDLFGVATDADLGFVSSRTRKDAERWAVAAPRASADDENDDDDQLLLVLRRQQP
jgi:transcriptional regulator with XRE-family HTH domain